VARFLWIKTGSNQLSRYCSRSVVDVPPSCPPERQIIFSGMPFAAIPLAFACACPRGKSESCSPWLSRVGAVIRLSTPAGLEAARSDRIDASGSPVVAAC